MSTGLETWSQNLNELSVLYPFEGTEMILAVAGIASWIIWHIYQINSENKTIKEETLLFADKAKLEQAMEISNAETLATVAKGQASDS